MNTPRVIAVSSRSFGSGQADVVAQLTRADCRVERIPVDHDLARCAPVLAEADAWIAGVAAVTEAHLDTAPRLRVLARYGVGVDAVDLAAAAARDVVVTSTPGANEGAVAEHALGLTLAALRSVTAGDRAVRAGEWSRGRARGREISALTVGAVGAGRIGLGYLRRSSALGADVLAHDPFIGSLDGIELVSLTELVERCDVVSLHLPGGEEVVTEDLLAAAPPGLVLVNTARADLVDEDAVARSLRSGRLAAFAADTLRGEGGGCPGPLISAELADRVVVTPHTAAQTVQAIDAMSLMTTHDVLAVLDGRAPEHPVEAR